MRGKLHVDNEGAHACRLIPAHAGKTENKAAGNITIRAHPRACGENNVFEFLCVTWPGSSPRMRGKLGPLAASRLAIRLIPAHAGKTWGHRLQCPQKCGSSPRMRGKLRWLTLAESRIGLIPAHAGKTCPRRSLNGTRWAHPRACGENLEPTPLSRGKRGSSPRMRGKLTATVSAVTKGGLIPAHAGKTTR